MRIYLIITCVLLFISYHAVGKCITESTVHTYQNIKCSNVSFETFMEEYTKEIYQRWAKLVLININFEDLNTDTNNTGHTTTGVLHKVKKLTVFNNTANIKREAFSILPALALLKVHRSNLTHFTGFKTSNCNGTATTFKLDVTSNNISTLTFVCNCSNGLVHLVMKQNNIISLDGHSFGKCPKLLKLDVSYNQIRHVASDTFKGLPKLQALDLKHNQISILLPNTFIENKRLSNLHLEGNIILESKQAFRGLKSLSNMTIELFIDTIEKDTFKGLSNLKSLNLTDKNITVLEPGAFNGLQGLVHLHLTHNQISTLYPYTFNETKNLTILNLTDNMINEIHPRAFNGLSSLVSLQLKNNHISIFPSFTLNETEEYLILLDISKERKCINSSNLDTNLELTDAELTAAELPTTELLATELPATELPDTELTDRVLRAVELPATELPATELPATELPATELPATELPFTQSIVTELAEAELRAMELPPIELTVRELTILTCKLSDSPLLKLRQLDLGYNKIVSVKACAFQSFPALEELLLNNNELSELTTGVFSPLSQLKILNLSYNRLKWLDDSVTYPLINLVEMELSFNQLVNFNPDLVVSHLKHLRYMGLAGNYWECHWLNQVLKYLTMRGVNNKSLLQQIYYSDNINGIQCVKNNQYQEPNVTKAGKQKLNNSDLFDDKFQMFLVNFEQIFKEFIDKRQDSHEKFVSLLKEISHYLQVNNELLREIKEKDENKEKHPSTEEDILDDSLL